VNDQQHTELVTDTMPAYWAERINRALEKTARSVVEIGKELVAAQAKLKHGEWLEMFKTGQAKLKIRAAQKFMQVANNPALANAANLALLPPSPTALVALSKLPAKVVEDGIKEGHISPGMTIAAAGKFVREHLPEPGGDKEAEDASAQQAGGTYTRKEFLVVLWDDADAPPAPAPEKSYGAKTYPNIAFFRFHEVGDTRIESDTKYGLTHTALFVVPGEQAVLVKDKHGRTVCKATCRLGVLSVRGDVPEPAVVPGQIVEGGYEGVLEMISSMFPDALKVVSTTRGEAPSGWQLVPRECKESTSTNASGVAPDSTKCTQTLSADVHSTPVGAAGAPKAVNKTPATVEKGPKRRKAKLATVLDRASSLHDGLCSITTELRRILKKHPEHRHLESYKARERSVTHLDGVTMQLAQIIASLGVPGEKHHDESASIDELPFTTSIVARGGRSNRVVRMTEIMLALAKSIEAPAPNIAQQLKNVVTELESRNLRRGL
jgi:hypothetical protein